MRKPTSNMTPRPRLILAEDDDEIRALLETVLAADGFDVTSARDGVEMVRALEQARDADRLPYMIVTDHRMPGYSGLEVVEALRAGGWRTPIIMMTAFHSELDGRDGGADLVFEKPFDADDLRTAILYCIEHSENGRGSKGS